MNDPKAHEVLTLMANHFSEPGRWCRGEWDGRGGTHCIVGQFWVVLARLGLHRNSSVAHRAALALDRAVQLRTNVLGGVMAWNDQIAKNHREVSALCHEAALIAKEQEK